MRIIKIIPLSFTVSSVAYFIISKFSDLFKNESKIAPTTPKAADSVGEAIPAKILPKTDTIKSRGGTIEIIISFKLTF